MALIFINAVNLRCGLCNLTNIINSHFSLLKLFYKTCAAEKIVNIRVTSEFICWSLKSSKFGQNLTIIYYNEIRESS